MQKKWKFQFEETIDTDKLKAVEQITHSNLLARLLVTRGIDTEKKTLEFLEPEKMDFTSPYDFTDMDAAVERILKAVENNEFILIHGDFDADGITSTALLSKLLTLLKANFDIYIPNRETESHGLSTKAILKMRAKNKLKLVITCDCATNDVKEIQLLKSLNIDTIVTDHHEASNVLPEAYAIINPKAEGKINPNLSVDKINNLNCLAGVGVAFKLALAIIEKIGQQNFAEELLPLVAVGTIGDIVPVLGENRAFIKMGLENIEKGKNRGLLELLKASGIRPENGIKAENIAFQIVPRLNATGRLDTADEGYKLLISDNGNEIEFLCNELNNKNILRQTLCDKIFKEALLLYENSLEKNEKAIVLYKEDWHLGVIGIVASKLIEKYNKPVFMMCKDPNSEVIRSSVRSIPGINIYELLSEMKDDFLTFGGHKGAAGLSFNPNEHSIDEIKQKIFELAKEYSQDIDLTPVLNIDLKITPEDLTLDFIEKLEILEPCGTSNPYPIFAVENLEMQEQKLIGQKQNHLKFVCKTKNNNTLDCIYWNNQILDIAPESSIDIAFYPKINTFNGNTNLQLDIQDTHYQKIKKNINIYDHRKKKNILPQVCDFVNKNADKIFIYINNENFKKELLDMGFCDKVFIPKENTLHLMFFEYPEDETTLKQIIETANPKNVHFLHCNKQKENINNYISKILGMTKYATLNKNGFFDIYAAAKSIGENAQIIEASLELLNDIGAIKINSTDKMIYNLEYITPVTCEELTNSEIFEDLKEKWENQYKFQEEILTANEKELSQLIQ